MKIKVFNINQYEEVNDFTKNVELLEDGAIQVSSEGNIIVFYREGEEYKEKYIENIINSLKKNIFHEEIKIIATEQELAYAEELAEGKSEKSPEYKVVKQKQKTLNDSHEYIEVKKRTIDALTKQLN